MAGIEGGCLCGAVRYRIEGPPLYSVICHCRSCRRAGSAAAVAWLTFERDRFRLIAGQPHSFRSSAGTVRTHCGTCGSPLTFTSARRPEQVDVTTCSLDDPERFPPTREVWLADRLRWGPSDPALEHFAEGGD